MFALLIVLFSTLLFLYYNFCWKRRRLPAGPTPLPIVGNLPALSTISGQYRAFQEWAGKYGPVYTVWMGENPVVIVTDFELMKATFINNADSYTGRAFLNGHFMVMLGSVDGVIRTEGEQWKQLRRFFLKAMSNYGGNNGEILENLVLDAVFKLIAEAETEVKDKGMREHSIDRKVDLVIGSVINQICFSQPFYGEARKQFLFLKQMLDIQLEYFASFAALLIEESPWIRHLPYFSSKYNKGKGAILQILAYVQRVVDKRIEERKKIVADNKEKEKPVEIAGGDIVLGRDILDQFLDQIEQTDQQDPNNYMKLKYLPTFLIDLFAAGQETTSNTINFLILYLMLDQAAQVKLHAELDKAMAEKKKLLAEEETKENGEKGEGEFEAPQKFRQSDRAKLHFTNAVVHETQRLCNLIPINLQHVVTRDVQIGGHSIVKGTKIIPQMSAVLYDQKIFPRPERFWPERFLDANGQFKKVEELIPFSIGKRQCPGEALARLELFLFTANFFYKFHVYPPNPLDPPSAQKRQTFAVKLPDYQCHVEIRH